MHSKVLIEKPELVVLNKADLDADNLFADDIRQRLNVDEVLVISAVTGQGVKELIERLWKIVRKPLPKPETSAPLFMSPHLIEDEDEDEDPYPQDEELIDESDSD